MVTGSLSEEAFFDQLTMLTYLTLLFAKLQAVQESHGDALPMDMIEEVVGRFFRHKGEESVQAIIGSMLECFEQDPRMTRFFDLLFKVDTATLNETDFVESVRDQHLFESEDLMIHLFVDTQQLPTDDHGNVLAGGTQIIHSISLSPSLQTRPTDLTCP